MFNTVVKRQPVPEYRQELLEYRPQTKLINEIGKTIKELKTKIAFLKFFKDVAEECPEQQRKYIARS